MIKSIRMKRAGIGTALAAALAVGIAATASVQAIAQPAGAVAPANDITLALGQGRMVRPSGAIAEVFVANENIADVHASSPTQLYIFGKAAGTTSVYATDRAGRVVYSANIRVGQNLSSVGQMLRVAMPEANITATPMNGMVLLTGTVAQPADAAEAERLAQAFVGEGTTVVSRLRTATPQQVLLRVRVAEVNRTLARDIGMNLLSRDQTGGFRFGIGRGNAGTITDRVNGVIDPATGLPTVTGTNFGAFLPAGPTTLAAAGHLLGIDILSTLNLGEQTGLVTTLAEPSLVALSGETSTFLAGGEFPIPVSQSLGTVTIEYKSYGVGLAFSPIVLEDGRIQMRIRPEVSELSNEGTIRLNGFNVPALTVRRTETTVELGSGQSFMIAGLLRNHNTNSIDRAPFLGNIPILGALFRSTHYQRAETELVIVITPYLVQPVSNPALIALPTDGHRNPDEAQRVLIGQGNDGRSGEQRPGPTVAPTRTVAPGITTGDAGPAAPRPAPASREASAAAAPPPQQPSAQPGFNF